MGKNINQGHREKAQRERQGAGAHSNREGPRGSAQSSGLSRVQSQPSGLTRPRVPSQSSGLPRPRVPSQSSGLSRSRIPSQSSGLSRPRLQSQSSGSPIPSTTTAQTQASSLGLALFGNPNLQRQSDIVTQENARERAAAEAAARTAARAREAEEEARSAAQAAVVKAR